MDDLRDIIKKKQKKGLKNILISEQQKRKKTKQKNRTEGYPGKTKIIFPHVVEEIEYRDNQSINPDHVYLNLLLNNNTTNIIPMSFIENRSQPILRKPNDYVCSVIRFFIGSHNTIPLFLFTPIPGGNYPTWNIATLYNDVGFFVYYNGFIYQSIPNVLPNIGHQPDISPTFWVLTAQNPALNKGIYSLTLSYGGIDYKENIIYNSINNFFTSTQPSNWLTLNQNNFSYYSIFLINQFVDEVNQAFLSAYNRLPGGAPPKLAGAPAPFIVYDSVTNLLSLVASRSFDAQVVGGPTVQIWMSIDLYQKFGSLPISFTSQQPSINGKDLLLHIYEKSNNSIVAIPPDITPALWQPRLIYFPGDLVSFQNVSYVANNQNVDEQPNIFPVDWTITNTFVPPLDWNNTTAYVVGNIVYYLGNYWITTVGNTNSPPGLVPANWNPYTGFDMYRMDVEYQQLYKWFDLTSIVFISSLIPVVEEFVPSNGDFGNYTSNTSNSTLGIITDFQFELNGPNDPRQNILYTPTAEYRLINMVSDTPFTSLNVTAYWTDRNNNYFPIYLNKNGQASIKFLFRKRRLLKSDF